MYACASSFWNIDERNSIPNCFCLRVQLVLFFHRNREMENINKVSISWVGNFSSPIIEFVKTLPASPSRSSQCLQLVTTSLSQIIWNSCSFPYFLPVIFFLLPNLSCIPFFMCLASLSTLWYILSLTSVSIASDNHYYRILKRISDKSYVTLP